MSEGQSWGFRTRSIHEGSDADPATGAVVPPVHFSSTFVQPGAGEWGAFDYTRSGNPTRAGLEKVLASLEGGTHALAFSSGMAATHAVTMLLSTGDHLLCGADVYGGTYRLLHKIVDRAGISVTLIDTTRPQNIAEHARPNTKLLWLESPGNPLLSITDIDACARLARERNILVGVDNTFATPALSRPLELGADIVMHSATKYLGGHSDLLGGALIVKDAELRDRLYFIQNATGAVLSPFDCFLCHRGVKTLALRVGEHSRSALEIARHLEHHPRVVQVNYPGLESHPAHELAKQQMVGGFGGMVSFELVGGFEQARRLVKTTRLFQLAVSLGACESLIEQPATMSHASYDRADRQRMGIGDGLIRLSVGLEDVADLKRDLDQAIQAVC